MKLALAQICTLEAPFETDVADYAAGACPAIELWLGKLETYLASHSVADVRRLLDEHNLAAPVAAYQGGLLVSQGEARREHWDHFRRRLPILAELGAETLIVAADVAGSLDQQALERLQASLVEAAQLAGQHRLRLALEFQARSVFCNNLQTAAALIYDVGSPHLGICLDLFHFQVGPSKLTDLAELDPAVLFHVQLCDLAGHARELATDGDRVLPGDGDFPLEPVISQLRALDYQGYVSVELMNPVVWRVPPLSFGEIGMTALRKVLGLASME
ncbi:MAG: sugar phosphate isomerase/epimerase [Pirellulales bacterium]